MRNERAIIMFLSYVIGFNAAFIAFGIPDFFKGVPSGSVVAAIGSAERASGELNDSQEISLGIREEEGNSLVVSANGTDRLLSIYEPDNTVPSVGKHSEILYLTVSPSEQFVYYCEVQTQNSDECVPLVYSVAEDVIHRVWIDEERNFVGATSELNPAWEANGKLRIGNAMSLTSDTPWVLRS